LPRPIEANIQWVDADAWGELVVFVMVNPSRLHAWAHPPCQNDFCCASGARQTWFFRMQARGPDMEGHGEHPESAARLHPMLVHSTYLPSIWKRFVCGDGLLDGM